MSLSEKMKNLFRKPAPQEAEKTGPADPSARPKKTCQKCGKMFSYDPSMGFVPNLCKSCKEQSVREREEKQRAGAPREIKRKCRECGKYFTFPNTLPSFPKTCPNCRKTHQAAMKARYSRKPEKKE